MEPLGHHEAHEAVQVLGLLWHWHRQPVSRPVGAAGLGSGSQSLAPAVSQCILFSAAPANHEPEFLQVRDAMEVNEGTSNHEDVEQLMRVELEGERVERPSLPTSSHQEEHCFPACTDSGRAYDRIQIQGGSRNTSHSTESKASSPREIQYYH